VSPSDQSSFDDRCVADEVLPVPDDDMVSPQAVLPVLVGEVVVKGLGEKTAQGRELGCGQLRCSEHLQIRHHETWYR
jgi:hypothetical protein